MKWVSMIWDQNTTLLKHREAVILNVKQLNVWNKLYLVLVFSVCGWWSLVVLYLKKRQIVTCLVVKNTPVEHTFKSLAMVLGIEILH